VALVEMPAKRLPACREAGAEWSNFGAVLPAPWVFSWTGIGRHGEGAGRSEMALTSRKKPLPRRWRR